jgi:hypothetical protein
MAGLVRLLARAFEEMRNAIFRGAPLRGPEVIVYDPSAQKPKDLDDPFIDPKSQERVGKLIAGHSRAKAPDAKI